MAHLLIIRFSALGDVAMTIPAVRSLAIQYPELKITVLTRKSWEPLFSSGLPGNVSVTGADLSGKHKTFKGLQALYKQLKAKDIDAIADFHGTLRSVYLSIRFRMAGIAVSTIDKGRSGKRKLVRKKHKKFKPQKNSFERYADVLAKLGYPVELDFTSIYDEGKGDISQIVSITGEKNGAKWLGIAPFAKHVGKIYPIELQEQVVAYFAAQKDIKVFLFGGGKKEQEIFDSWTAKYPTVSSMIGKLDMQKELNLISYLDVMLSMDSANMHLASLVNTRVVSVWGATHPYAGFMGWHQKESDAVQIDMSCRPCSVYGKKPCHRKDYACLYDISPKQIIEKVEEVLK
ncbi:glycosyltransferase family 9 protein [Porphyromonas macacae]|uniref:glycosyltransferase family 9 protein n=1 Tax=Porphyromonas macacae TaxID=28115 RepID=UPI0024AD01D6|nr:glycosyltransferase family 9 protein [Porphyromonas macacae]